jgi:hypothetical protein
MDNNLIDATPLEVFFRTTHLTPTTGEIWFNESRVWPAKGVADSYLQLKFDPTSTSGWSAALNAAASYNILAYAGTKVHVGPPKPHGSNYDTDDVVFVLHMSSDGQTWTGNVTEITSTYPGNGVPGFLDGVDMGTVPYVNRGGCDLIIAPTVPVGTRFVIVKGGFGSASSPASGSPQICGIITIIT